MSNIYHVYVNNIEVGSLPVADYEFIVQKHRKNWHLWGKQIGNLAWAAWNAVCYGFKYMPIILSVAVLLLALLDFSSFEELVGLMKSENTHYVARYIQCLAAGSYLLSFALYLLYLCFITNFSSIGYKNIIQEAIDFEIKRLLEVPANGELSVLILPDLADKNTPPQSNNVVEVKDGQ